MKKVIFVVGVTSRLGESIAKLFLEKGDIVYGSGRNLKRIPNLKGLKRIKLDITSDIDVLHAIQTIVTKEKRLDIIINTVGNTLVGPFDNHSTEDIKGLIDTNAIGFFRIVKAVKPFMKKQKGGKIITISSLNGLISFPNFAIYSASKFALFALGQSLYYENKKDNIHVTTISPGAIYSGIETKGMPHTPAREKFFILKALLPMVTVEQIVERIVDIIDLENPPSHIILGRDAYLMSFLSRILPTSLFNRIMLFVWQK